MVSSGVEFLYFRLESELLPWVALCRTRVDLSGTTLGPKFDSSKPVDRDYYLRGRTRLLVPSQSSLPRTRTEVFTPDGTLVGPSLPGDPIPRSTRPSSYQVGRPRRTPWWIFFPGTGYSNRSTTDSGVPREGSTGTPSVSPEMGETTPQDSDTVSLPPTHLHLRNRSYRTRTESRVTSPICTQPTSDPCPPNPERRVSRRLPQERPTFMAPVNTESCSQSKTVR